MKRSVEDWTVAKLYKDRTKISFPEYQREPNLWSVDKQRLLIDSILRDIDIPKLYFNRTESGVYEVVDGQQRLWAIWNFLDGVYPLKTGQKHHPLFSQLTDKQQRAISEYELQITVLHDADDEYLRELFIRLQLGLLLLAGEKLHAATGEMKEFIFKKLSKQSFVTKLGIPARRFARETLGAQIAINSFSRAKIKEFSRTRYEDLEQFFKEYEHPQGADRVLFEARSQFIIQVLKKLSAAFGDEARDLRNRSYILSLYLFSEDLEEKGKFHTERQLQQFAKFALKLWRRVREELTAGFDRRNRELYEFETYLSSAPGEKYQIERRHTKLLEYFKHFETTGAILGDPAR